MRNPPEFTSRKYLFSSASNFEKYAVLRSGNQREYAVFRAGMKEPARSGPGVARPDPASSPKKTQVAAEVSECAPDDGPGSD